jgi:iron complex transport system substrate-binding protein
MDRPPARIVSLIPSVTEILFAVGAGDAIVGVTTYCTYPPEARQKPKVGDLFSVSVEGVVALKPDLVVATRDNPMDVIQGLRALRIPVFVDDPQTIDEVLQSIRRVGQLTGRTARADSLIAAYQKRLNAVDDIVRNIPADQRPSVFVGNPLNAEHWTPGPGTFTTDIIARAGGRNIADDLKSRTWGVYSFEQIIAKNPEVILASTEADQEAEALREKIVARAAGIPGWKDIRAVKNSRILVLSVEWLFRPGPRVILAVEQLAAALHPARFRE